MHIKRRNSEPVSKRCAEWISDFVKRLNMNAENMEFVKNTIMISHKEIEIHDWCERGLQNGISNFVRSEM